MLDDNADVRAAQLAALQKTAEPNVFEFTLQLVPAVHQFDVRGQLPLIDMSLPALRALSVSQYNEFIKCFLALVDADQSHQPCSSGRCIRFCCGILRPQFEPVRSPQIVYYGLQQLGEQCSVLLSALARASQQDDDAAFEAGARQMPEAKLRAVAAGGVRLNAWTRRCATWLRSRQSSGPDWSAHARRAFVPMQRSMSTECELLRAICDMLDCPMPPLVAGQEVSPSLFARPQASRVS